MSEVQKPKMHPPNVAISNRISSGIRSNVASRAYKICLIRLDEVLEVPTAPYWTDTLLCRRGGA
jgi:hypothetical protein